jgi:hypothetical protein
MNPLYLKTRFLADTPHDGLPESFAVITACNPDGIPISEEENAVRTESFRIQLLEHGLHFFPVTGFDPDSPHREQGFGVVCEAATAMAFGRQWEQEAIYRVEQGEVILVSCGEPPEEIPLGSWLSRVDG